MNVDLKNGLVAGVIAACIAFGVWYVGLKATASAALGIAALFFLGTAVVTYGVARAIRGN